MTDRIPKNRAAVTTLVTVTYADRIHYLEELLRRAFVSEGVARAVVVSNASRSDLSRLEEAWGDCLSIIRLGENTGSANGYAVGIRAALDLDAHYLWLMDDDNAPMQGALGVLHRRLAEREVRHGSAHAAVLGFRSNHQADIASGVAAANAIPPRSSFFGFHYRQVPFKIWRRISRRPSTVDATPGHMTLPYAPYGGLLAGRRLFELIGLPMRDLVLYADDTEYTYRITAKGGVIELVTRAELEDLEGSWNLKDAYPNSFIGWLSGGSDLRAFYAARNQAWFERNCWVRSGIEYRINQAIYLGLLSFFAIRTGRGDRLRLLRRAIKRGQTFALGVDQRFPLP